MTAPLAVSLTVDELRELVRDVVRDERDRRRPPSLPLRKGILMPALLSPRQNTRRLTPWGNE